MPGCWMPEVLRCGALRLSPTTAFASRCPQNGGICGSAAAVLWVVRVSAVWR